MTKPVSGDKKDYCVCTNEVFFLSKNHKRRYGCIERLFETKNGAIKRCLGTYVKWLKKNGHS